MVLYDQDEWESKVIHFSGDCHDSRAEGSRARRPLIHFYAFMLHVDPLVDSRVKRFARDRLRYRDRIFCKASQVSASWRVMSFFLSLFCQMKYMYGAGAVFFFFFFCIPMYYLLPVDISSPRLGTSQIRGRRQSIASIFLHS